MTLPEITDLQFVVLEKLVGGEKAGRDLRAELKADGVKKDGPAFYMLMARMEEAGYIRSKSAKIMVENKKVVSTKYRLAGPGVTAYNAKLDFYRARSLAGAPRGLRRVRP